MKGKRELETTRHMKNYWYKFNKTLCNLQSLGLFLVLISFRNAWEFFGDKKSFTEKALSPYERLYFANRARDLFQNKSNIVLP